MRRLTPWILALTHAALFVGMLARITFQPYPGPKQQNETWFSSWHSPNSLMVAGRDLHHDSIGEVLLLADIPVFLLLSIPEDLLRRTLGPMAASYVFAGEWLVLGSLWWFAVPWFIARRMKKKYVPAEPGAV